MVVDKELWPSWVDSIDLEKFEEPREKFLEMLKMERKSFSSYGFGCYGLNIVILSDFILSMIYRTTQLLFFWWTDAEVLNEGAKEEKFHMNNKLKSWKRPWSYRESWVIKETREK